MVCSWGTPKNWATAYDFPARKRGDVVREVFTTKNAEPMQAFVFNTRRKKFADPKTRLAFNYAFDFEWANKNLFYGQYVRTDSYFANSELAATGLPEGLELEILESLKDKVPPQVFTERFKNPVGGNPAAFRRNLRKARNLLRQAGWVIKDRKLVEAATGEQMSVEFLLVSPAFERVVLPYKRNLERLGIRVSLRTVDPSQYRNRLKDFEFDIIVSSWQQSLSPGNEQRNYWGSVSADRKGSRNLAGIKNPAIDKLIELIIFAKTREQLVAATRALDRVLIWNHYLVPQWHSKGLRSARWNRFGIPRQRPDYGIGFFDTWWYDKQKALALKNARS